MEQPKVIPGVHLLFRRFNEEADENEYLLHKRINSYFADHYSVPGGHIDDYETPEECVIREGMEELGVKLKTEDIKFVNVIYRSRPDKNDVRIDFCHVIENWEGEMKLNEPEKHEEPFWCAVSKFPKPIVPYVEEAIKDIESGKIYSEANI